MTAAEINPAANELTRCQPEVDIPTESALKILGLPILMLECTNDHAWKNIIPPWDASWNDVRCPTCKQTPVVFRWGGFSK